MQKDKTIILTHRGLDPDKGEYFGESSYEAFDDQLRRGFGIEFDIRFTKDRVPIALHDKTIERITHGKDSRLVSEISCEELTEIFSSQGTLVTIPNLFSLIEKNTSDATWSALHVKHDHQNESDLNTLLEILNKTDYSKYIIFDTSIAIAKYIREKNPSIQIFASVAHPYDIKRFNSAVGGTLLSLKELEEHSAIFSGAWLDEWDKLDEHNNQKKLYTTDTFNRVRLKGLKIAVVSPELHGTSPNLLGNESHPDAVNKDVLTARMQEILQLEPDAYCTDYPDHVKNLLTNV
ncbi:MAG: hypothetical protein UU98_C0001G0031 [Parcubacteria group bacterium GW2011_GWD2_42_14]|nr:MAG: hypothetical protein UU98_C0001G0031 [Parcubacteria group bacterium GW2011_GWD2_42_14]